MAHFAELNENSIVTNVIVISNETIDNLPFPESEPIGVAFCQSLYGPQTIWKQTSYNGNFRYNYAGIGFVYDQAADAFIAPQPSADCVLNTATYKWDCPKPPISPEPILDNTPPSVV